MTDLKKMAHEYLHLTQPKREVEEFEPAPETQRSALDLAKPSKDFSLATLLRDQLRHVGVRAGRLHQDPDGGTLFNLLEGTPEEYAHALIVMTRALGAQPLPKVKGFARWDFQHIRATLVTLDDRNVVKVTTRVK
jgi:hypothetical protein